MVYASLALYFSSILLTTSRNCQAPPIFYLCVFSLAVGPLSPSEAANLLVETNQVASTASHPALSRLRVCLCVAGVAAPGHPDRRAVPEIAAAREAGHPRAAGARAADQDDAARAATATILPVRVCLP